MMRKVLKYDLKYMHKVLSVFYVILLAIAFVAGDVRFFNDSYLSDFIRGVLKITTIMLIVATLLMSIWIVLQRFIKNVYGDESYFTHTLPISREVIYSSKFLAVLIVLFSSTAVSFAAWWLVFYSKSMVKDLEVLMKEAGVKAYAGTSVAILFLLIFIVFVLQMTYIVQCGHFGIIVGYRADNRKNLKSIIAGLAMYFGVAAIGILLLYIAGLFSTEVAKLFYSSTVNIKVFRNVLIAMMIYYLVADALIFGICIRLFKKGVNVE